MRERDGILMVQDVSKTEYEAAKKKAGFRGIITLTSGSNLDAFIILS